MLIRFRTPRREDRYPAHVYIASRLHDINTYIFFLLTSDNNRDPRIVCLLHEPPETKHADCGFYTL